MSKLSPAEIKVLASNYLHATLSQQPPLPSHLEQFYIDITVDSTYTSHTKVIRPKSTSPSPRPLIIYFFGGGFLIGEPDQVTSPAREWAERYNATVLLPDYRLTPDFTWPTPMKDAFTVVGKIASGYSGTYEPFFGASPADGFVIGGLSAGATVAGVVVGLAMNDEKYRLDTPLTGVFLNTPWFFNEKNLPSRFKDKYQSMYEETEFQTIKKADIDGIFESLKVTDWRSPWISPANFWLEGQAKKWPKTYFQACQFDLFRDDALIFEQMLREIGTDVRVRMFPEDGHAGMSSMPAVHKSKDPTIEEDTVDNMGWLLASKDSQ